MRENIAVNIRCRREFKEAHNMLLSTFGGNIKSVALEKMNMSYLNYSISFWSDVLRSSENELKVYAQGDYRTDVAAGIQEGINEAKEKIAQYLDIRRKMFPGDHISEKEL